MGFFAFFQDCRRAFAIWPDGMLCLWSCGMSSKDIPYMGTHRPLVSFYLSALNKTLKYYSQVVYEERTSVNLTGRLLQARRLLVTQPSPSAPLHAYPIHSALHLTPVKSLRPRRR